jgi:hypothetical protein
MKPTTRCNPEQLTSSSQYVTYTPNIDLSILLLIAYTRNVLSRK